jgi:hypothetical protein
VYIYIYGGFRSHGGTPKSSFLMGFSIKKKTSNYWGIPISGNLHTSWTHDMKSLDSVVPPMTRIFCYTPRLLSINPITILGQSKLFVPIKCIVVYIYIYTNMSEHVYLYTLYLAESEYAGSPYRNI